MIKYVLVRAISCYSRENIRQSKHQWILVNKQFIPVTKLTIDKITYCYVNIDDVYYTDKKIYGIVGSLLAFNDTYDYSGTVNSDFFGHEHSKVIKKMKNTLVNEGTMTLDLSTLVNLKITQAHHTHYRVSEVAVAAGMEYDSTDQLLYITDCRLYYIISRVMSDIGPIQASVATFMLYYVMLPEYWKDVFTSLLLMTRPDKLLRMLKVEGTVAKQSQHVFREDMNYVFELAVLQNRVDSTIDWEAEKDHRVHPVVAKPDVTSLRRALEALFSQAKSEGRLPMRYTWEEYWSLRWGISPSGAVHSEYSTDNDVIKTIPQRYRNKTTVLAAMANGLDHAHFLSRPPAITAHTSTKYEWGKTRALYGCDLTSHLMADFGMNACEDTMPSFVPIGSDANEDNIIQLMERMKHGIPFCYDYDDFNSQHSCESMEAVIDAWLTIYSNDISTQQYSSVLWTKQSIRDMKYRGPDLNMVSVGGTLFSGWRLTSFINSALNFAYLETAGLKDKIDYSLHNGDDVFGMASNLGQAYSLIGSAEKIGIRAQVTKMSIGTISEFLRTDVNSTNPNGKQYLTRGCATAVHARAETNEPTSCIEVIVNNDTRVSALVKRGGSVIIADKLNSIYNKRLSRLFSVTHTDINTVLTTHLACGGLSKVREMTGNVVTRVPSGHVDDVALSIVERQMHALEAYATQIIKNCGIPYDLVRKNKLKNMAYTAIATQPVVFRIGTEDTKKTAIMQALYHAWSPTHAAVYYSKVRAFTATLQAVGTLSLAKWNVLTNSGDPALWANVMF